MANTRSEKHPYPSRYGRSRWITAAQYLAELLCERRARQEKKSLPLQFWKVPPWDGVFRQQAAAANRLIRRLDPQRTGAGEKAIARFLRSDRGKGVYSLAGAWVVPLVEQAHRTVLLEAAAGPPAGPEPPPPEPGPPRPPLVTGQSTLSKLKGLD